MRMVDVSILEDQSGDVQFLRFLDVLLLEL